MLPCEHILTVCICLPVIAKEAQRPSIRSDDPEGVKEAAPIAISAVTGGELTSDLLSVIGMVVSEKVICAHGRRNIPTPLAKRAKDETARNYRVGKEFVPSDPFTFMAAEAKELVL